MVHAFMLQAGSDMEGQEEFWGKLEIVVERMPNEERVMVGAALSEGISVKATAVTRG